MDAKFDTVKKDHAPSTHLGANTTRAPQQSRSRETQRRIVSAARELMNGRDYQTISVQEICRRADVSASSFYARFETKESLLFEIHDTHRRSQVEHLSSYLRDVAWNDLPTKEAVRCCLRLYVADRRRLSPFLLSLMLAEVRFPDIAEERARVDSAGVDLISAVLIRQLSDDDPDLPKRIEFAMRVVCTAAQEAIRPPSAYADRIGIDDSELVDRLTEMFCLYVGAHHAAAERAHARPHERSPSKSSPTDTGLPQKGTVPNAGRAARLR